MKKIDARERLFVLEYMIDLKVERAALAAGYAPTTARTKAFMWVSDGKHKPHVYFAIKELQEKRARALNITADRVVEELALIAFQSHANYDIDDKGNVLIADGCPPEAIRAIASIERKIRTISRGDVDVREVEVKIRTWNKNTALQNLGKHLGIFGASGRKGDPIHTTTEEVTILKVYDGPLVDLLEQSQEPQNERGRKNGQHQE